MRIIVGVDDSPFSAAAVEFVRRMSWPEGTHALVVHAVKPIVLMVPEAYVMMAEQAGVLLSEQRAAGAQHVKAVAQLLEASGWKADACVVDGDPREALVDAARSDHADLVVLGSHGRTGLTKLFLGSVASHVVTHAPCSVLVVRRPAAQ